MLIRNAPFAFVLACAFTSSAQEAAPTAAPSSTPAHGPPCERCVCECGCETPRAAPAAAPVPTRARQQEHAAHAVYAEVGGMGILYSLNYDYRPTSALSLRVGGSLLPCVWGDCTIGLVLLAGSYLSGGPDHYLEIGGGLITAVLEDDFAALPTANLGWRYQPSPHGLLLRATFTPLFGDEFAMPWAGASIGYAW